MDETEPPFNVGMESPQPPPEPTPDPSEAINDTTAEQRVAARQQEDAERRAKARHNRLIVAGSLAGVCLVLATVSVVKNDSDPTPLKTTQSGLTAASPPFQPADLPKATHPTALPKPHRTIGRYTDGIHIKSNQKHPKKKKNRENTQPARQTFQPPAPVVAPRRTAPPPARRPHKSLPDINLDNQPDPPAITTPNQIIIPDSTDQIPETGGATPNANQLPPPPVPPEDNGAARFPGASVTGGKAFHS